MSVLYSLSIMLSGFTLSDIDYSLNGITTIVLFVSFTLFINIVMLNLLIAIMGDIFDRIQENAKAEFMFARANIILEIEGVLSEKQKADKEWFPTWLQVLVSSLEDDEVDEGGWAGRVRALKDSMKRLEKKLEESMKERKEEVKEVKEQVEESKKQGEQIVEFLQMLCSTMTPEEQINRKFDFESNHILKELGATEDDLNPKPTDAESKNKVVKDLKEKIYEESPRLVEEIEGLWKRLEVSEDDQKTFKKGGGRRQAEAGRADAVKGGAR